MSKERLASNEKTGIFEYFKSIIVGVLGWIKELAGFKNKPRA